MKAMFFAMFCFVAGASLGAYQYIISTDAELAVNPSETSYSAVVSVNAQVAGNLDLDTVLETRYRTFAESSANSSVVNRRHPGIVLIFR